MDLFACSGIRFGDVAARRLSRAGRFFVHRAVLGTTPAVPDLVSRNSLTESAGADRGAWLW